MGTHAPGYFEVRGEVPPPPPYSPLAHNCSGKHSGMLAYCVQCGLPKDDYLVGDHPLQQSIRRAVAHFTSTPEADLVAGTDGCSAPNYAVPLACLASAFARLAWTQTDAAYGSAPRVLADAMTAHPEMASARGRSDLELTRAGRGDWSRRSAPRASRRSACAATASASRSRSPTAVGARCAHSRGGARRAGALDNARGVRCSPTGSSRRYAITADSHRTDPVHRCPGQV